jgi:hypothetical protein
MLCKSIFILKATIKPNYYLALQILQIIGLFSNVGNISLLDFTSQDKAE